MPEWTDWDLETLNVIYKSFPRGKIKETEGLMLKCMSFNPGQFVGDLWSTHLEQFVTDETHYYLESKGYTSDKYGYFDSLSHEEYKDARALILEAIALKSEHLENGENFLHRLREKGGLLGYITRIE